MRIGMIVALAVCVLAMPKEARGQSDLAPQTRSRSGISLGKLDFGAGKEAPKKPVQPVNLPTAPSPAVEPAGSPIDCAMVKPVPSKRESAMPVLHPDPNVELPMKVVPVPACKR